jgi:uncharacterized small protein (DUF1192 family)
VGYGLSVIVALGLSIAASVAAQQALPGTASAARIAELESRIAQLTQQINQQRANRLHDERWAAPQTSSPTIQAPVSSLQRTFTVASVESGCPQGAVCLVVRCDVPSGP